jgi:hypothetical protein
MGGEAAGSIKCQAMSWAQDSATVEFFMFMLVFMCVCNRPCAFVSAGVAYVCVHV